MALQRVGEGRLPSIIGLAAALDQPTVLAAFDESGRILTAGLRGVHDEALVGDGESPPGLDYAAPLGWLPGHLLGGGDLRYNRYRNRHRALRTWTSPDPLAPIDGFDSWLVNRGNPLRWADPMGLASTSSRPIQERRWPFVNWAQIDAKARYHGLIKAAQLEPMMTNRPLGEIHYNVMVGPSRLIPILFSGTVGFHRLGGAKYWALGRGVDATKRLAYAGKRGFVGRWNWRGFSWYTGPVKGGPILSRAAEFGFKPYYQLTKDLKGTGLQAHHLIEKRFAGLFGGRASQGLSVAVTKAEHQAFTRAWRALIPYGPTGTGAATRESVMNAAREVYSQYPEILKALGL